MRLDMPICKHCTSQQQMESLRYIKSETHSFLSINDTLFLIMNEIAN
jgi:hypothetical protein